jgi:predicted transglutaminase-like cysteine proteinase
MLSPLSRLLLTPGIIASLRAVAFWMLSLLLSLQAGAWNADRFVRSAERLGPRTATEARALVTAMGAAARLDEEAKLRHINKFFNEHTHFQDDTVVWGQVDYWASPLELLDKGEGDCEDYAIAKYFTLIAVGVPSPKLRLVYVRAQLGGPAGLVQAHMVLAYYGHPDMQPLILDNLINDIRPASMRPDLAPVFSFNAEGLWQGVGQATAGDPLARLSRWRDVLNKARQEGMW